MLIQKGYTLLEILVVIALLGLLSGLAIPRLDRLFDSLRFAFERDDVLQAVAGLPFTAYREGKEFVLDTFPAPPSSQQRNTLPLTLPEGWKLQANSPIRFRANGICSGGNLTLTYADRSTVVELKPPLCQPD